MIKSEKGKVQLDGDFLEIRFDALLLLDAFKREGIYERIIEEYEFLKDDFAGLEVKIYDFKRPI